MNMFSLLMVNAPLMYSCTVVSVKLKLLQNRGALQLARAPHIMPQTKHYSVKYHFVCDEVKKRNIKLNKIETKKQL